MHFNHTKLNNRLIYSSQWPSSK